MAEEEEDEKTVLRVLDYRLKTLQESVNKSEESTRRDFDGLRQTMVKVEEAVHGLQREQWGKGLERLEKNDEQKELRIRVLEDFRSNITGRLIIIGSVAGFVAVVLGGLVVKYFAR